MEAVHYWIGVAYIISAVLCAVGWPLCLARYSRFKLTYGHIMAGFLLAMVPAVNTILALFAIHDYFSDVKVFKQNADSR